MSEPQIYADFADCADLGSRGDAETRRKTLTPALSLAGRGGKEGEGRNAGGRFEVTAEMEEGEFAWRELAREHLADYGEYVLTDWVAYPVHQLICGALEDVKRYVETNGDEGCGNLIIEMPPQGGKSTMAIKLFISFMLGKQPDMRALIATYGADLSKVHSEETQDIVRGERYAALFGRRAYTQSVIEIDSDTSSKSFWRVKGHRGSVTAVGVGGGGVGRSFELIVVDDPYKNMQEAKSEERRKLVSKWFKTVVLTRRRKGTAIILIHTRWDRQDLIGEQVRLMASDPKSIQWKILSIPALPLEAGELAADEDTQALAMKDGLYMPLCDPLGREAGSVVSYCPELFPEQTLDQTKRTLEADGEALVWFATYQQKPRPESGDYFGRDQIQVVDGAPEGLRWYRYIDLALGKTRRADWNACAAVGVTENGDVYVRDMIRVHNFVQFVPVMKAVMRMEHRTIYGVESNSFQELAFRDFMNDRTLAGVAILPVRAGEDKESDAMVVKARAMVGKLYFVRGAWVEDAISEFIEFPHGNHDDQVDTVSRGLKMVMQRAGRKAARSYQG